MWGTRPNTGARTWTITPFEPSAKRMWVYVRKRRLSSCTAAGPLPRRRARVHSSLAVMTSFSTSSSSGSGFGLGSGLAMPLPFPAAARYGDSGTAAVQRISGAAAADACV